MAGMAIAGLGSVVSGGLGFLGSQNTAKASQQASQAQQMMQMLALQQQQQQYQQGRTDLQPYRDIGQTAGNMLVGQLPQLTQQFAPTQAQLESTPGYQWNLSQGLKAVTNSAAARGLGVSGAAQKGAANYATGLADNTLKTQFDIDQQNKINAYNKLYGTTALGATAAAGGAQLGQQNANAQGTLLSNMGATQGAGILGAANAQQAGLNALGGGINTLALLGGYGLQKQGGVGGIFGNSEPNWDAAIGQWNQYGTG